MELGLVGLGRMGLGMAQRALDAGIMVVGFDVNERARDALNQRGGGAVHSLTALVMRLARPRHLWLMLPPGPVVDDTLLELISSLQEGDTVVDGGNSHYRDSQRRAATLARSGIAFVDVGTNSGVSGAIEGYCLSVGGDDAWIEGIHPLLDALGSGRGSGWAHFGPSGSGHFAKMVHNAILYGLIEAYAEGFAILQEQQEFPIDLEAAARLWSEGSLIGSTLLDLTRSVLARSQTLDDIEGSIGDTGAGRWGVLEAMDLNVSAPILTEAVLRRIRSREDAPYSDRFVAALRHEFGGHELTRRAPPPA